MPDETAGVHINGRHRLGLVDHQVSAGLEIDTAFELLADFLFHAVQIEDRPLPAVEFDARGAGGHEAGRELQHAGV